MKTRFELVKSDLAERCSSTIPATNHPLDEQEVDAMQSSEQWRPVPGYEGFYEVSDQGRMRSLDRTVEQVGRSGATYRRALPGRILALGVGGPGYPQVNLRRGGNTDVRLVHRLVLEAFIGPCPDAMEACHLNDVKTDNRLVNLRWDTSKANKDDMLRNGGHHQAGQTHCKHGHEFTSENTIIRTDGGRKCKTCKRIHSQSDAERANHRERNRRYSAKSAAS